MTTSSPTVALVRSLGWIEAARVAVRLAFGGGGHPFAHLEPPSDSRERRSRAQAAMAIRLYRVLLSRGTRDEALAASGAVIEAGAIGFLGKTLGDLDGRAFANLPTDQRRAKALGWIDQFFTATAHLDHVEDDEVGFTVTACALARLCAEAGHPELAPAFCRGDALFFAAQSPPIHLERATTLAEGGASCPFRLRFDEREA